MFGIKEFTYSLAIIGFLAAPASANDLINNNAAGYVGGDIVQDNNQIRHGGKLIANVGSVKANTAINNSAQGEIHGSIYQSGSNVSARVGSIEAEEAYNNTAEGYVNGDVIQEHEQTEDRFSYSKTELNVGTINNKNYNGYASMNSAQGYVDGEVIQYSNGTYARTQANVGSVTSR